MTSDKSLTCCHCGGQFPKLGRYKGVNIIIEFKTPKKVVTCTRLLIELFCLVSLK